MFPKVGAESRQPVSPLPGAAHTSVRSVGAAVFGTEEGFAQRVKEGEMNTGVCDIVHCTQLTSCCCGPLPFLLTGNKNFVYI